MEASSRNATSIPAESGPDRPGGISNLDTHTPSALANRLLAALPHADYEALKTHLTIVPMAQGTLLFDVDQEVDQIFFPLSGMVSLLVVLKNGNAVETATMGREGVVGAMAGLGLHKSRVRAVIQLAGTVARIPAPQFQKADREQPGHCPILCIRYNEALLAQARVTAACNLSHSVEARFCRWLLAKPRPCRERHRAADTRISLGNARRAAHVSHGSRHQDAGRGRDQLFPGHHQNCRSGKTERDFLRML